MRILMVLVPDDEQQPGPSSGALRLERFASPYYILVDAHAELVLASPSGGAPWIRNAADVPSSAAAVRRFRDDKLARDAVNDTLALEDVHAEDFEGLFCIGVPGPIWSERGIEPAARMISRFLAGGKPVVCIPSQLDTAPYGSHTGLLIVGEGPDSPARAARALLGAIAAGSTG